MDGEKRYIIAPLGLKVGDTLVSGAGRRHRDGQRAADRATCRSARRCTTSSCSRAAAPASRARRGTMCQLLAKEGDYAQLRLPSGEVRKLPPRLHVRRSGRSGNIEHENIVIGKAGPQPLAGHPPARARRGEEPGRPPDGRRRRQVVGRPSSVLAVGPAGEGLQDAAQARRSQQVRSSGGGRSKWRVRSRRARTSSTAW